MKKLLTLCLLVFFVFAIVGCKLSFGKIPMPTLTPTPEISVQPTVTPTPEVSIQPVVTPTSGATPTVSPAVTPTVVPTVTPTVVPTVSPTVVPTVTPTVAPTVSPTVAPTVTPTVVPTVTPTVVPTVSPTVVPTVLPTVAPSVTPTVAPTVANPLANVVFAGKTVTYDGSVHELKVENLPEGYEVKYTNNGKKDVGTYTVFAQIRKIGSSIYMSPLTAVLIIEAAPELPPEEEELLVFEGILFESKTFPCDGEPHSLVAENVPNFATVEYYNNSASKPTESKTARVVITAEGYKTLMLTATLAIGKGTVYVTAENLTRSQYIITELQPKAVISYGFKEGSVALGAGAKIADCTGTLAFEYPHDTRVAGEYDILPSGYSSELYDFVFIPGKFTVQEVKTDLVVGGAKADEKGGIVYNGKDVHTVGVNYYSLFNSLLPTGGTANPWDRVKAGLAMLSGYGVRVIRFNCGVFHQNEAVKYYFGNEKTYYSILDKVMDEAARNNILLIPSMFWNDTWIINYYNPIQYTEQGEVDAAAMDGVFNKEWSDENSKTMQLLKKMTEEIIRRYQHHPAVFAWEFGNENNNSADLPNWKDHTASVGRIDTEIYSAGMARWADWVLAADEFDRMIMTGDAQLRKGQYSTYLDKNSWGPDTLAQHFLSLQQYNPGKINGVSVHIYGGYADKENPQSVSLPGNYLKDCEHLTWQSRLELTMQATAEVAQMKEMNMSCYVGECGVANGQAFFPGDTAAVRAERQRKVYDAIGQAVLDTGMPIALLWNYDPVIVIQEKSYEELNPNGLDFNDSAVVAANRAAYQKFGQHGNGSGIEWSWNEKYQKGLAALNSIKMYNQQLKTKYGEF